MAVADYIRTPEVQTRNDALAEKLQELWETKPGLYGWTTHR